MWDYGKDCAEGRASALLGGLFGIRGLKDLKDLKDFKDFRNVRVFRGLIRVLGMYFDAKKRDNDCRLARVMVSTMPRIVFLLRGITATRVMTTSGVCLRVHGRLVLWRESKSLGVLMPSTIRKRRIGQIAGWIIEGN